MESTEFSHIPPHLTISLSADMFVTISEPTLMHSHHPNSIVYIRFPLGVVYSLGCDKHTVTCIHHCSITQNPKKNQSSLLCRFILPAYHFWQPLTPPTVSIVLPFPEGHTVGTTQYITFSDWLLSLMHIDGSSVSFHDL